MKRMTQRQAGVALIQVLLITSMILILVVQLSKDAREQVRTSISLKEKAQLLVDINNELEKVKFDLLTTEPNRLGAVSRGLNLYGEAVSRNNLIIELQDQAGLLSLVSPTTFLNRYLDIPQQTVAARRQINDLLSWQGLNAFGESPLGFRGGLMHYSKELNAVPGWQNADTSDEYIIYYPTKFYNPVLSPDDILNKLFPVENVQLLTDARKSNNVNEDAIAGFNQLSSESVAIQASDFVQIRVTGKMNNLNISRTERVHIELGSVSLLTSLSL